jgi:cytochrome oxidase Cu insertion factor (SCO1/SenC/PrrC family)
VAWLVLGGAARAGLLPPERGEVLPRGLTVSDDQGAAHDLRAMAAGAPTLFLPIFTRCAGTCPMTAHFLEEGLRKARVPFRVVVFSFDAGDTAKDLRDFRERFALPAEWLVVRSGDAGATRAFLDALDFHFMKSSAGFDHPNQTFVFSPQGAWAATFAGATFAAAELQTARERALAADDSSLFRAARAWLLRPEAWILLACAGLILSLIAIVLARRAQAATAPSRD